MNRSDGPDGEADRNAAPGRRHRARQEDSAPDQGLEAQGAGRIQDKQVRVTGKSRDDLQEAIALVRGAKLELPLQFTNFRD